MNNIVLAERMTTMKESATLALNARAKKLSAEGHTIYNLTAGELATDTPTFIQEAVSQKLHLNKYTPVAGLLELRSSIAAHATKFYDLDWIKAENIVVTSGAKPAIAAALLAILNQGDEVLVPVPAWTVSYKPLIEMAGGIMVPVSTTEGFDLDIPAIAQSMTARTKAIIINSPNNPTGAIYSHNSLIKLAKLLNDKDITIIADDIYTKLVYEQSFVTVPSAGFAKIIIINGFSKSQAITGWRIGYLIADKSIAEAATIILSHLTGNAPLPSQYAAIAAMDQNDQPSTSVIDDMKRRRQLVASGLSKAGIKFHMPSGAFYFLIDLRDYTTDSFSWCEKLLVEKGVAIVPGDAFGAPGFARLTYVADDVILEHALEALTAFVKGK